MTARVHNLLFRLRDEEGQGLIEYVLIIAIVSLGAVAALTYFRDQVGDLFSRTGSSINGIEVGEPPA